MEVEVETLYCVIKWKGKRPRREYPVYEVRSMRAKNDDSGWVVVEENLPFSIAYKRCTLLESKTRKLVV